MRRPGSDGAMGISEGTPYRRLGLCRSATAKGRGFHPRVRAKKGSYERQGLLMGVSGSLERETFSGQERLPLAGFPGDGAA